MVKIKEIPVETRVEIATKFGMGSSASDLGKEYGICRRTVYNLVKKKASYGRGHLGQKLFAAWENECNIKQFNHEKPSLIRACFKVFGLRFITLGIALFTLEIGLRVTQPVFLGYLVSYYGNSKTINSTTALFYAVCFLMCSTLNVLFMHPYMFSILHMGMQVRVAMCSMIYRKALRLSKTPLRATTSSQVLSLLTNDVGRLDTSVIHMHYLWLGPVEIAIITYLLYIEIGISSFFGVVIMILFLPLQGYLGKKSSFLRLKTALLTEERVRIMQEIITGIQVIKMYAWEIPFGKIVQSARLKEIRVIRKINCIKGILQSFIIFLTRISVFSSLISFVLLGKVLTAEKAFVITAYYNILRTTLTVYFPMGITQFAEVLVSCKRIQLYMLYEETKVKDKSHKNQKLQSPNTHTYDKDISVVVNKFKAKWNRQLSEYTLDDIYLNIKSGDLVAVIGPVGSGKSSLMQAILGELPAESGSITTNGTISFASQEPWLFTGTVRQNILFGSPMDKQRYRTVISKCALERDLLIFPKGDKTIVGERGSSLSGGQKARISLARAIYRRADVYLLDDPLSSVDTHVGRHLFDHCVRGFLQGRIIILVTHQLHFVEQADVIAIMDKGRISAVGDFESLQKSGLDFAKLLTREDKEPESVNALRFKCDKLEKSTKELPYQSSKLSSRQNSVLSISSSDTVSTLKSSLDIKRPYIAYKIDTKLYKKYFEAIGCYILFFIMMCFCILTQLLASVGDYFLSYWINNIGTTSATRSKDYNFYTIDLFIFAALNISVIFFAVIRSVLFFNLAKRASTNLHDAIFQGVTRAAMYFFDTNSSSHIMNCFSKDMGQVDEVLPGVLMDVTQIFLALLGIVIILSFVNPWNLLVISFLCVIFYLLRSFYLNTSREIKRIEAKMRIPVYAHFSASLNGLTTIRAFGAQSILTDEFDNYQDTHSSGYFMLIATSRAFAYWLDCCCIVYIAIVTFSFFLFPPKSAGDVGLAITQAMGMTGMVQWGMRQSAELENVMMCMERVVEYKNLEPEGKLESLPNKKPSKTWPEEGFITVDNLSLRYSPDPKSEYVIKSLNLSIQAQEKIGIVGRTGAGKSSLINALFRLSYTKGSIIIDKRDIDDIGLHDLRSRISIIPQEPILFSGTMRYNLDPFEKYTDTRLWEVLNVVNLKSVVLQWPQGLQTKITDGGTNFSVGQKQLICLARAILKENKILIMDEATANVDPHTDAWIQTTIRNKFRQCTVLAIAHRLHTVMDYDKILVMDEGRSVEFGSPFYLLTESKSKIFYDMVKQTGNSTFECLLKVSRKAHEENKKSKKDPNHFVTVPKVFMDIISKLLEPIANQQTNIQIQKSIFLDYKTKQKFLNQS